MRFRVLGGLFTSVLLLLVGPAHAVSQGQHDSFSGGRRALATMCIGVGQGIAVALERV